jgi:hypothetical protein
VCCHKANGCTVLMESLLISNGAEVSRIKSFIKIAKTEQKVQAPRKNINISAGSSQIKLK